MNYLETIYSAILEGKLVEVEASTNAALSAHLAAETILNESMIPAMGEVGRRFECNQYFVPEMLIAARAMKAGVALLRPQLQQGDVKPAGKIAIATVKGDLHDIGKNLVAMMLEGAGFEVRDLGTDVSAEKVIEVVQRDKPDIVALSALLTTTMPSMKETIQALEEAGLRHEVKIMVGGAPVTDSYSLKIGADGYAPDASRAASLAKSMMMLP